MWLWKYPRPVGFLQIPLLPFCKHGRLAWRCHCEAAKSIRPYSICPKPAIALTRFIPWNVAVKPKKCHVAQFARPLGNTRPSLPRPAECPEQTEMQGALFKVEKKRQQSKAPLTWCWRWFTKDTRELLAPTRQCPQQRLPEIFCYPSFGNSSTGLQKRIQFAAPTIATAPAPSWMRSYWRKQPASSPAECGLPL